MQEEPPGTVGDRPPRILVVDDEPSVRALLAATLTTSGFEVLEAGSGDQALRMLAHDPIDAVLLDRTMPDMDGIEVLRWIRRTPSTRRTPVLMVTARDATDELVDGFDVGADDYVVKPFEPDELVARLHRHLRGRSDWDEIVGQEVARRMALVDAAGAASALSLESGVRELCDSLAHLPGLRGVALIEIAGDVVAVLGSKGEDPVAALRAEHGTRALGRRLLTRARRGAWLEPITDAPEVSVVAVAPVRAEDDVVALLLALPHPGLGTVDIDRLHASVTDFAALASGVFGAALLDSARRDLAYHSVMRTIEDEAFVIAFQRIVDLETGGTVGHEALARFDSGRPPLEVFSEAALVGAGHALEIATLEAALRIGADLPPDQHLSVNISPSVAMRADLRERLRDRSGRRVVIELSELEPVHDYDALRDAVARLGTNVVLSVDDAGAGFASLAHILALEAAYVKLDRSWVAGIDRDPAKRALVAGIDNFARETGATVIAEGIETEAELDTVRSLGIRLGQGYLLGRPELL